MEEKPVVNIVKMDRGRQYLTNPVAKSRATRHHVLPDVLQKTKALALKNLKLNVNLVKLLDLTTNLQKTQEHIK